jgi:serine/threonine protein kinase
MFQIPFLPPPKLTRPEKHSTGMNEFIAKCLVKDASKRCKSSELLAQPFVITAPLPQKVLPDLLKKTKAKRDSVRAADAAKVNSVGGSIPISQ